MPFQEALMETGDVSLLRALREALNTDVRNNDFKHYEVPS